MKKTIITSTRDVLNNPRRVTDTERKPSLIEYRVLPMFSPKTGAPIANQYTLVGNSSVAFQSYYSLIAVYDRPKNTLFFGEHWNYSRTTLKYLRKWLRMYAASFDSRIMECSGSNYSAKIRNAIKSGYIVYVPDMR